MAVVLPEDRDSWDCQSSSLQEEERSRWVLAAVAVEGGAVAAQEAW